MLMMLLQNSPGLLEQLGGGATLIKKELERREAVEKMNVGYSSSPSCLVFSLQHFHSVTVTSWVFTYKHINNYGFLNSVYFEGIKTRGEKNKR